MASLKPGMYVRCPVKLEEMDEMHPRLFVLGKIQEIDEVGSTVRVKFYDLFGSEFIYGWAKSKDTYPLKQVRRATSPAGFPCLCKIVRDRRRKE